MNGWREEDVLDLVEGASQLVFILAGGVLAFVGVAWVMWP